MAATYKNMSATEKNIGNVLFRKGEYENALLRYQKVLAIEEQALGSGHVDVAGTCNNIHLGTWTIRISWDIPTYLTYPDLSATYG